MNKYRKRYLDFKRRQDERIHNFLEKHAIYALSPEDLYQELEKTGWPESCITRIADFLWLPDVYLPELEGHIATIETEKLDFLNNEDNFLAMALYAFDEWDILYNGYKKAIETEIGISISRLSDTQLVLLDEAIDMFTEKRFRNIEAQYE